MSNNISNSNFINTFSTGDISDSGNYKYVIYHFDDYLVKLRLNRNNEFIGIDEIKVRKNFISPNNLYKSSKINDIEKYFVDDED